MQGGCAGCAQADHEAEHAHEVDRASDGTEVVADHSALDRLAEERAHPREVFGCQVFLGMFWSKEQRFWPFWLD